jgi:hypothetical protein
MSRLLLRLVTAPSLVTSALLWLMAIPASAEVVQRVSDPILNTSDAQVCVISQHSRFNLVCERASALKANNNIKPPIDLALDPTDSPFESQFTEAESDAALALFGCDCQTCLNGLRVMRSMSMS